MLFYQALGNGVLWWLGAYGGEAGFYGGMMHYISAIRASLLIVGRRGGSGNDAR
jgi:hypothetical protein